MLDFLMLLAEGPSRPPAVETRPVIAVVAAADAAAPVAPSPAIRPPAGGPPAAGGIGWPAQKGEPYGFVLRASSLASSRGAQFQTFLRGQWDPGPSVDRIKERRTRGDGSVALAPVPNPVDPSRAVLRMNLRSQDLPPNALSFRSQINVNAGVAGVTNELPMPRGRQWSAMKFSFGPMPRPFPGEVIVWQRHENKSPKSWSAWSPPIALQLRANARGGAEMYARMLGTTLDRRGLTPGRGDYVPNREVVLVPEIRPGVEYTLVVDFDAEWDNTGACVMTLVEGSGPPREFVIAKNEPTVYPKDALELDERGAERPGFESFYTWSLYAFHQKPAATPWELDSYLSAWLYRQHQPGMTAAGWLGLLRNE